MGLMKQLIRSIKGALNDLFGFITRRDSRKRKRIRKESAYETTSWHPDEPRAARKQEIIRIKHKRKIPGLKQINRILAGIWLFINFVISQAALGSLGSQSQWMVLLFFGNCYFILKYLWSSRSEKTEKAK